jgi:hypothetical protein
MQIIETKINSIIEIAEGILNFADNFSFVIREENDVSSNITKLISDLSTFLIEEKEVQEWPGTKLLTGKAKLYRYNLRSESASILHRTENNLFNWLQPELPEDLVFYKGQYPVFISVTHEKDAYFELDNDGINILKQRGLI